MRSNHSSTQGSKATVRRDIYEEVATRNLDATPAEIQHGGDVAHSAGAPATRYRFYSDAGHGWLRVKLAELDALGIRDDISAFSYADSVYAYLEEDCDMGAFMVAKYGAWMRSAVHEMPQSRGDCFVRSLNASVAR